MAQSNLSLTYAPNLLAYFQEELRRIIASKDQTTTEDVEAYVVHMLDEYMRPDETRRAQLGFERAAALMLSDAADSTGDQSIEAYRHLGDACLYHCGLFERQLSRRAIKSDYYQDMGRAAYARLSRLLASKQTDHVFRRIFSELSQRFDLFVTALQELSSEWGAESWMSFDFEKETSQETQWVFAKNLFHVPST